MNQVAKIWVAYATEKQQFHIELQFSPGMSVADAIAQSGLAEQVELPENFSFGIFGVKIKDQAHLLEAGDRVEIYRALTINPKDIRRNRAKANPVGRYCRGNRYQQLLFKS
ncbi:RnfH family protein [Acinetobacter bereziniae]|uniref:UPF0125 protein F938_01622 n=2 Tax=Acinetobacter bereziniae TaxID=106648 RepID=N9EQX1_ACIBZ|nr:RnfH family protein [Acinetobacter bereziniae]ENV23384.1 hypothetical protein F963_00497 [Acinetobacter bereziniae NIPH 3]ENV97294.1 hypothetical protein F938_01622 [Acinetobacter bereziniae LMG 1003 = CIP 70.12]MBJ8550987.1 RnfH family protein [Acinetobacter bereziniae]MBJ9905915.1 RnfH family protein [Acinetobacter bereziniae]MBJ9927548.1 RnfH family protein [Acinetobacter bereziniae]